MFFALNEQVLCVGFRTVSSTSFKDVCTRACSYPFLFDCCVIVAFLFILLEPVIASTKYHSKFCSFVAQIQLPKSEFIGTSSRSQPFSTGAPIRAVSCQFSKYWIQKFQ